MSRHLPGDAVETLAGQVRQAAAERMPVRIQGQGSKGFYGRCLEGRLISTLEHEGIISYEPSELTIHARAGTSLDTIESALAQHGQVLAFEPPLFDGKGTLGGAIATGLSGPGRPFTGSARDSVLGVSLINGRGQWLRFGGQVMKNVAGYDVSRFVTASLGTLGLITDVSLKVLPRPRAELTLVQEVSQQQAIDRMAALCAQPWPLSAACWNDGRLYIRLWAVRERLAQVATELGGEALQDSAGWWSGVRHQQHTFFRTAASLWRLSVSPASPQIALPGDWFVDWAGAQRWLSTREDAANIRAQAEVLGGHATLFRGGERTGQVFHPLATPLLRLHQSLKRSMDPENILNPGAMYAEL